MKKMMYLILLLGGPCLAQERLYGTVTDEQGRGLPGATVSVVQRSAVSAADGRFALSLAAGNYAVKISFVGYRDTVLPVILPLKAGLLVALRPAVGQLREVVVSTGYQELPKERATGSFVQVDRGLLERSVSTSVLDRLRDVVPGLSFRAEQFGVPDPGAEYAVLQCGPFGRGGRFSLYGAGREPEPE